MMRAFLSYLALGLGLWCAKAAVYAQATNANLAVSVTPSNGAQGVVWGTNQSFHIAVTNAGPAAARDVVLEVQVSGGIIRSAAGFGRGGGVFPPTGVTSGRTIRQTSAVLEVGEVIGMQAVVLAAGPGAVDVHGWARASNDPSENQGGFVAPVYFSEFSESAMAITAEDSVYDRKRGIIYLYERWIGTIWPIVAAQPRILDPIQTGQRGHVALSADGESLYVGMHFNGVTRIDTRTWEQTNIYWTNFSGTSWDIKVSPIDPTLVAVSHSEGTQLIHGGAVLPESTRSYGPIAFAEDGAKLFLSDVNLSSVQRYSVTTNGLVLESTDQRLSLSDFDLWGTKLYGHNGIIYDGVSGEIDLRIHDGNGNTYAGQEVINRWVDTNGARRIQRLDRRTLQEIQMTGHYPFVSPSTLREAGEYDLVAYSPISPFGHGGTFWVNLAPKMPRMRVIRFGGRTVIRLSHLQPNARHRVERTERLDSPNWHLISEGIGPADIPVGEGLVVPPRAFYRVVMVPE